MATRMNFSEPQRLSAFDANAGWLRAHRVDGVELSLEFAPLRAQGLVYYCENCLFCHTAKAYFDVDHMVSDSSFKAWGKHEDGRNPMNMVILCKSLQRGDLGCNQSKGAGQFVPKARGLAVTHPERDMNCIPFAERPKIYEV
jgi:hypothetical protein